MKSSKPTNPHVGEEVGEVEAVGAVEAAELHAAAVGEAEAEVGQDSVMTWQVNKDSLLHLV